MNPAKKIAFGATILSAGVILLLFNFGYLDNSYKDIVFSWQSLIIALGFINLFSKDNWYTGFILILIGGLFLAPLCTDISFSIGDVALPVGLIAIGLLVLFKKKSPFKEKIKEKIKHAKEHGVFCEEKDEDTASLDDVNVFSGGRKVITDPLFEGGSAVNIFGGLELDLRQTTLLNDNTIIEVVNIFGGLSIIIPPSWEVKTETISILGGFMDKRTEIVPSEDSKKLIIKGVNIFGGGELKTTVWVKG